MAKFDWGPDEGDMNWATSTSDFGKAWIKLVDQLLQDLVSPPRDKYGQVIQFTTQRPIIPWTPEPPSIWEAAGSTTPSQEDSVGTQHDTTDHDSSCPVCGPILMHSGKDD